MSKYGPPNEMWRDISMKLTLLGFALIGLGYISSIF